MSETVPAPAAAESRMVSAPGGQLQVRDFPGVAPALVALHGFPDDSRICDQVAPLLAPRRVVAVDWLGYGRSDRIGPGSVDGARHQRELRAVLDSLELGQLGLVAHDASGPDAIHFALGEPDRVGQIILLNTYYGHAPALRLREMIRLLADPALTPLADAMDDPNQRLWLLAHPATVWAGRGRPARRRICVNRGAVLRRPSPARRACGGQGLNRGPVCRARSAGRARRHR